VLVLPDDAIVIELLWDTPADPDQTDTGPNAGTDMDLHFAHPLSAGADLDCDGKPDPWFTNPYDTFWFNPNPTWGNAKPELELNDTDGGGPEHIDLPYPGGTISEPMQYDVGVHYLNDHGFGASYATVNVWIQGNLVLQIDKVQMKALDMWHSWPY
jgi:hypothetical protein